MQIYTDSLAAIQAIRKTKNLKKLRSCLKMQNASLLWQIVRIQKIKKFKVELHKVKGHSRIEENEEADRLAKNRAKSSIVISVKWPWTRIQQVVLYWFRTGK